MTGASAGTSGRRISRSVSRTGVGGRGFSKIVMSGLACVAAGAGPVDQPRTVDGGAGKVGFRSDDHAHDGSRPERRLGGRGATVRGVKHGLAHSAAPWRRKWRSADATKFGQGVTPGTHHPSPRCGGHPAAGSGETMRTLALGIL